ncbi:MAG TPA: hypothetical protein VFZ25_05185 [Chloroflexota bacterium]|nr:hypothetical protein [Chloroflexota bacterium]
MFRSLFFKPRRLTLVVALVASAGLLTAASASGVTVSLTPDSQAVCSGCTASWGGAWGDVPNYTVSFSYFTGSTPWTYSGSATSHGWTYEFYTCTGQTYQQHLHVKDGQGATADAYATTSVAKGAFCAPTN